MQQVLADKVKLIVSDSKLAFMQGRFGSYINENEKQQYHPLALK